MVVLFDAFVNSIPMGKLNGMVIAPDKEWKFGRSEKVPNKTTLMPSPRCRDRSSWLGFLQL